MDRAADLVPEDQYETTIVSFFSLGWLNDDFREAVAAMLESTNFTLSEPFERGSGPTDYRFLIDGSEAGEILNVQRK